MYASGMSLGSAMTFALACAPANLRGFWWRWSELHRPVCNSAPPVPIIYFHGTADPIVPFEGGKVAGSPRGSITARVSGANQNMADGPTMMGVLATPQSVISATPLAPFGRPVRTVSLSTLPRQWRRTYVAGREPMVADFTEERLGKTTQAVDASALMWDFFKQVPVA